MIKDKNFITWLALLVLMIFNVMITESGINRSLVIFLTLLIIAVKFSGIFFQFMEMKLAHIVWKLGFVTVLLLFVVTIGISYLSYP